MDTAGGSLSLRRYGASPGSHSHGHFQVLIGLSGTLELEVAGRSLCVAAGGGCVIEPGARHHFQSPSARGSLCLVLDSHQASWAHCAHRGAPPPTQALVLAHYLSCALRQGHPLAQAHGPALLLEAWLADAGSATPSARRRAIDWPALRSWAAQHCHDDTLTVADLAERVHLSPGQFAARCRSEQGMSAMAWLRALRLEQARLLRAGGMAVAEVARRCGYRSPSALTAALRREGA